MMTPTDHDALVSLKEYADTRFNEVELRIRARCEVIDAKIGGLEKAVEVARDVLDARLESMNGVYAHLKEQTSHFASKETVEYNGNRIGALERQMAEIHGSATGRAQIAIITIVTSITAIVTIAHMLWK